MVEKWSRIRPIISLLANTDSSFLNNMQTSYSILVGVSSNVTTVLINKWVKPRFFCRLSIVPLDMDNGTFNSSHTDVVEKVNFVVPASQHGGTSVAEGSP